jgi:hypothetical protein
MLLIAAVVLGVSMRLAANGEPPSIKSNSVLAADVTPKKAEGTCGGYGTAVDFVGAPSEAARKAAKEEKLVFVLHVSGHFEDPRFT